MAQSKHRPAIRKQGEQIVIPCNLRTVTQTDTEDGTEQTFYKYEEITLDRADMPGMNAIKKAIVQQLSTETEAYIYQYYSKGQQSSIQSYASKANRYGLTSVLDECEAIYNWINDVMTYYNKTKDAVVAANTESELISVTWDFATNVPKLDTLKSRREIQTMLES